METKTYNSGQKIEYKKCVKVGYVIPGQYLKFQPQM